MTMNALAKLNESIKIESIPSLPSYVLEIAREVEDTDTSTNKVAGLISQDIGLSARILKLANSPIYARSTKPTASIKGAVERVGFAETKNVCLSIGLSEQFTGSSHTIDLFKLWEHSLAIAMGSQLLVSYTNPEKTGPINKDLIYSTGLMHDIGLVVLDQQQPALFREVKAETAASERPCWEVEYEIIGYSHADVSALVMRHWGFPSLMAEVAQCHHEYELSTPKARPSTLILRMAEYLCHTKKMGDQLELIEQKLDPMIWRELGIDKTREDEITEAIVEKISEAELMAMLCRTSATKVPA